MRTRISLVLGFVAILAVTSAYGQSAGSATWRANVPFKFMAGDTEMPAGSYVFVAVTGEPFMAVRSSDGKTFVRLSIIERMARTEDTPAKNTKVVFNAVGEQKALSEVWPSGTEDGFLLQVTKQEHKHVVVKEK